MASVGTVLKHQWELNYKNSIEQNNLLLFTAHRGPGVLLNNSLHLFKIFNKCTAMNS